MSIGNRIRQARQQKGYTQEYLAERLGFTQGGYRKIETDEVKLKVDTLLQLAQLLEVAVSRLLCEPQPQFLSTSSRQVNQSDDKPDLSSLSSHWKRERRLYEQLLRSQEAQLQLQQDLLACCQEELYGLKTSLFGTGGHSSSYCPKGEVARGLPYSQSAAKELLYQD